VTRVQSGKAETLIVNFKAIAEGSQSFYLQPGDTVSVDERLF
jgi:2-keto-4-pentenoate hydratase/2-oxohepta-3-ene-1,7-dioic acid hydratase in catechol pathway